jgi:disintegrin and metalloproteinase domain-containing protein 17
MHLEATRSFYSQFGGSPPRSETAINYLLFLMKAVNDIFINTNFFIPGVLDSASPGSKGLEVASITVVTDQNSGASYHQDLNRNSEELLREFSVADWSKYCLSHLFIANSFSDSARLGVAYIANAQSFISGGICSRRTRLGNLDFYGNTGLSTFRGQSRLLLIAESVIVTAHEIGHNWGSAHDDTSVAECNPSQDNGGKFLMYPVAQDGSSTNNILFSNCSIRGISRVLSTHESDCFVEPQDDLCGNYVVDPDESCDPGPSGVQNNGDDCCYGNCTLRNGNRCSDANHDCCANCQLKPLHTICRQVEENNSLCIDNTVCNGVDITCPNENRYVSNGTNCGLMGRCVDVDNTNEINKTQCINFCELQNLVTCHCTGSDQCKICCLDENNNCKVYELEDTINLPEGSFCEGGTCNTNGECVFAEADLVNYIFDLLSGFNRDDIGNTSINTSIHTSIYPSINTSIHPIVYLFKTLCNAAHYYTIM